MVPGLDRAHQEPVRRVDVTVPVDQQEGGRGRGVQRLLPGRGMHEPGAGEQARGVIQFTAGVHADVGRLGQTAALVGRVGTEPGGTGQCRHRAERVPASEPVAGRVLQQGGDLLVRADGSLPQMPGAALRPAFQRVGECLMGPPAFRGRRQLHHRGRDQRMPEIQPPVVGRDRHQPVALGGGQVVDSGPARRRVDRRHVPCAVEGGEEQQLPAGGGQLGHP